MRLALFAAAALFAGSLAAHADTYQIAITSGTDFITFNVPSSPINPQQTGTGGFELNNLMFNFDGKNRTGDIAFYPLSSSFPGFEAQVGVDFFATEDIQVFSGTTEAPTFILSSFTSTNTFGLSGSTATIDITNLTPPPPPTPAAVSPEPSTLLLLATGLLAVAEAVRSRRRLSGQRPR